MKARINQKNEILYYVIQKIQNLSYVIVILFLASFAILAQDNIDKETMIVPREEVFEPALDLVSIAVGYTAYNEGTYNLVRLYNPDGSLWFKYSLLETSEFYYDKQKGLKLKLIYPEKYTFFKLKAVSKNWYEVEINTDTKESKFIKINDSFMKREGIKTRILAAPFIKFDEIENPLRETPNGKIKSYQKGSNVYYKAIGDFDGDWVQIYILYRDGKNKEFTESGWVRWKKENNLLIEFGYV